MSGCEPGRGADGRAAPIAAHRQLGPQLPLTASVGVGPVGAVVAVAHPDDPTALDEQAGHLGVAKQGEAGLAAAAVASSSRKSHCGTMRCAGGGRAAGRS